MKNVTLVCLILFSHICFGQQRIGIDVSTRAFNLNLTLNYHKVFKHNFLYSIGMFAGSFGEGWVDLTQEQYDAGLRVYSPFNSLNQPVYDTAFNEYILLDYKTTGGGFGFHFGIGVFHEFSIIHGIRFNLNNRIGFVRNKQSTLYYSSQEGKGISHIDVKNHFIGAISPEIYHTIRLSGRFTFYYGIKSPYFYSLNKHKFNPKYTKDLFNYWKPELSIGLTYVIGKCD